MAWHNPFRRRSPEAPRAPTPVDEAEAENLRAAVREHTRVKADSTRFYERRVQTMIDELFLRMGESHASQDP